jgi:type VII secretion protein EccE
MGRRSGSVAGVRVQQLVLIEIAAALPFVGWKINAVAFAVGVVLAVAVLVFALGRRRRRPMAEWMATMRAMKRRKGAATAPAPTGTDPAFAPAVECDPALRTYEYTDRAERPIGFVGDGTFLTAVVQVEAADEPLRPPLGSRPLPLEVLKSALDVEDVHLESVQLVQYTQPAPAPHVPEQAVAVRAYAPVQAQSQTPAVRITWIALKLDPELCPEAVEARGGGMGGAQRTLLRAADQLASRLGGLGFKAKVLDEPELATAIGIASCVNPRSSTSATREGRPSRRTQETVRAWRCDDRWHTTYWIGSWPQLGPGAAALANIAALLTSTPVMASTFSLTAARGSQGTVSVTGYVRLATRSDQELVAARRELERRCGAARTGLVRLDREQAPAVLATLPLGGTR